ncbi:hypothetical protein AOX55_00003842 [Sinorhizobium fredii CCBAU 25509]|nr:hypothetical protein SF83666_c36130 [Sinorhizobium fredii CCBAU 83666]AWM27072.1 hypothetical protein AOX55_00003842 [Sinorhizobium fredii CCBAU 25509]
MMATERLSARLTRFQSRSYQARHEISRTAKEIRSARGDRRDPPQEGGSR